jgi:Fe-S oxidoreductase
MESVMALYHERTIDTVAKIRVYSCMSCQTCRPHCPEGLDPGLGLSLAREILRELGDPTPRGLSFLLPEAEFNFMKAVEATQIKPADLPWHTNLDRQKPGPADTVLFAGCTGIMQPDLVRTALSLVRLIDPGAQALGGVDYCCGDTNLRAGNPDLSTAHFLRLVEGLSAFSPRNVVFLCPTCKAFFDLHAPSTAWSWTFITNFLARHIDKLGPLAECKATVTVHDACHLVRGELPEVESPRELLRAIPGVQIVEMENSGKDALCCGGSAMAAVGKPGVDFRKQRLQEAERTGADTMAIYCPGCQSVFASERPGLSIKVESILTLLGQSLGIFNEDKLLRYFSYKDGERVLLEAGECLEASGLPEAKLRNFLIKYFK